MKEVKFEAMLMEAEKCYKNKIRWHFHILTPACMFNKGNKFVVIFENEQTKEQLRCCFDEKPLKQGETLEALFYGRV